YLQSLRCSRRVLTWIIDRNAETEGPKLYSMPWTLDKDISILSIDKDTKGILQVDHPFEGFDIDFKKDGQGINTKYVGIQIARRSTPLSTNTKMVDEWITFIDENPLPSMLNFYDYDKIAKAFDGSGPTTTKDTTPKTRTSRTTTGSRGEGNTAFQDRMDQVTEDHTEEYETETELEEEGLIEDEPEEVVEELKPVSSVRAQVAANQRR